MEKIIEIIKDIKYLINEKKIYNERRRIYLTIDEIIYFIMNEDITEIKDDYCFLKYQNKYVPAQEIIQERFNTMRYLEYAASYMMFNRSLLNDQNIIKLYEKDSILDNQNELTNWIEDSEIQEILEDDLRFIYFSEHYSYLMKNYISINKINKTILQPNNDNEMKKVCFQHMERSIFLYRDNYNVPLESMRRNIRFLMG